MFAKYKIGINELRRINASQIPLSHYLLTESSSSRLEDVSDAIKLLIESTDGIIDGEKLKSDFFPTKNKKEYNVFISHSHGDIEEIEKFAKKLESYGLKCFVDSMVWKNIAQLQRMIDNKYSRTADGKLNYELVQQSTAHIHSLLSIALFEMINHCECCIFVQSNNSLTLNLNDTRTLSPWIYEEIYYINHIEIKEPVRFSGKYKRNLVVETRLFDSAIKMTHVVDLSGFKPLIESYFDKTLRGDDFLTRLYVRSGLISAL